MRRYPVELRDGNTTEGKAFFRKVIPIETQQEDHEGERTVDAIANKRGIGEIKYRLSLGLFWHYFDVCVRA